MGGCVLTTERLVLRRFAEADVPELFSMMSDDVVMRFLPWFAHKSEVDTAAFLEEQYLNYYRAADAGERGVEGMPLDLRFAVCLRDGGDEHAGCSECCASYHDAADASGLLLGFVKISSEGDAFDLGYAFRRDVWGRGYVTEAALALIEEARCAGFPYLTATHDEQNPASGRVMERCGMTYRYSYRERWQPKDFDVVFKLHQIDLQPGQETYRAYWDRYLEHWA